MPIQARERKQCRFNGQNELLLQTVYDFLVAFIQEHEYAPSLREIAKGCHIGRSTTIHYLDQLEAKGCIRREEGKARSIVLVTKG